MNKSKPVVYISIDVETDGPIPAVNSMLSLGAAAFAEDGRLLGTFSENLRPLEGAVADPDTAKWWEGQPEAWAAATKDPSAPEVAMEHFTAWVRAMCQEVSGTPVCVAYPAGFDFMFVYWYLVRFTGKSPFSFSCLDMKSFASAKLNLPYRQATKRNWPRSWFSKRPHTHVAVDDATEQGESFIAMLRHGNDDEY